MNRIFTMINSLQEGAYFSNSDREGFKTTISAQRSKIQDAAGTITTLRSTLQNASAGYDTKISSQEFVPVSLVSRSQSTSGVLETIRLRE